MATVNLLLQNVTATGAGTALPLTGNENTFTFQANINAACTALTVAIEGSLDGVNWATLVSHALIAGEITALTSIFASTTPTFLTYIRANITTLTGVGATASVLGIATKA